MVWLLRTIRLVLKKPQTKEKNKMGTESAERNDEQTNTELAAVDNRRSRKVVSPQNLNILTSFLGSILDRREWPKAH